MKWSELSFDHVRGWAQRAGLGRQVEYPLSTHSGHWPRGLVRRQCCESGGTTFNIVGLLRINCGSSKIEIVWLVRFGLQSFETANPTIPVGQELPLTNGSITARLSGPPLQMRVFDVDLEHCPNFGGQFKIIAAILDWAVIERTLKHQGLQGRAPPRASICADIQQADRGPAPPAAG